MTKYLIIGLTLDSICFSDNEPPVGFNQESRCTEEYNADGSKFTESEYEEITDRKPEDTSEKKRLVSVTFCPGEPVVFEDTEMILSNNKVFNDPKNVQPPPYHALFNQTTVNEECCKNLGNESSLETLVLEERLQQSESTGGHCDSQDSSKKDYSKCQEFTQEKESDDDKDKDKDNICDETKILSKEHQNVYADFDDLLKSSESAASSSSLPSENEYETLDIKTRESEMEQIYETLNLSMEDKNEPKTIEESTEMDYLLNEVSSDKKIDNNICDQPTPNNLQEVNICS